MRTLAVSTNIRTNVPSQALVAAGAAAATILLLAGLHVLSPEFDPSWRMVSEYANGNYGWVLSLMFMAWALSSWTLAFELWPQVETRAGKIGLCLLVISGIGEAMAALFDISHPGMHDLAGALGVPTMPIAASLVSVSLARSRPWSKAKKALLWTSNLIWISLGLFIATMVVMIVTFHHSGAHLSGHLTQLPPGVIAVDGWANRLYVVMSCAWVITVARLAINQKRS